MVVFKVMVKVMVVVKVEALLKTIVIMAVALVVVFVVEEAEETGLGKPSDKSLVLFSGIFPKWSDPPPHFWNF